MTPAGRARTVGLALAGAAIVALVVSAFTTVQARLRPDPVADRAAEIRRLATAGMARTDAARRDVRRAGSHARLTRAGAVRWLDSNPVGLFVHYGPQSEFAAPSQTRWLKDLEELVAASRTMAVPGFTPNPGVTASWVAAAKAAGASYLTVTAKHHDGVCLWASRMTSWDVAPRHDLLRSLSAQARRAGLRLFVYYSLVDFHELTYANDRAAYTRLVRAQMRELLTGYGPLAGVWFDLPRYSDGLSRRRLAELYALIHDLQPWALIGANHHGEVLPGEDFEVLEESLSPKPRRGQRAVPRQAVYRLGRTWFWSGRAEPDIGSRFKRLRTEARRRRISLLANIAPRPDGTIPQVVLRELRLANR